MIFKNPKMQVMRDKYREIPNFQVPGIVALDREEDLVKERAYLESLIASVTPAKQKEWLGRLLDESWSQYISAWFEMMLYGWLQKAGEVEVEPEVEGDLPDFMLKLADQTIVVEAKVITKPELEQLKDDFMNTVREIILPYAVYTQVMEFNTKLDIGFLVDKVSNWLENDPVEKFHYQDDSGNIIILIARYEPELPRIAFSTFSNFVSPDFIKPHLSKKAKQHKRMRNAGCPFVIAILLKTSQVSPKSLAYAWFGKPEVVINKHKKEILGVRHNLNGLHFHGEKIRHTSVSGTLVFNAFRDEDAQSRILVGWYIQNPFAKVPINPELFPVRDSYLIVEQTPEEFKMAWKSKIFKE